ncbi:MAG TPA: FkbM family methyltransferase [Cyclobacteriaceae bacterium]|jgi:FkbM family methyltransferase|nr:FkbM family methyltransferase [Cyclobacteriaceae bacterium]
MGYIRSAIRNFISFTREFGFAGAIRIVINNRNRDLIKRLDINKYRHPFFYRQGTTDFPILRIIIGQELVFKNFKDPRLIIDAGANVGYVSVFYANRFPKSDVISVEMEDSNFKMLVQNTSGYENIKPIKAALWNHSNGVTFGESDGKDSYNLIDQSDRRRTVTSVTLVELLNKRHADIIKLDIEGAEVEVLDDMRKENIQPNVLIVELHDRFRNGCSRALEKYLDGRVFNWRRIYEYEVIDFRK